MLISNVYLNNVQFTGKQQRGHDYIHSKLIKS